MTYSKQLLLCLFCFLSGLVVSAQPIYQIPWAQQQPKFVFPIYFEEGNGNKDTLYIGYDQDAALGEFSQIDDSIFGVKRFAVDTNSFYAVFNHQVFCPPPVGALCPDGFKANISSISNAYFPSGGFIYLNNGILPLKISWDVSALRSDSLPFIQSGTAPRGMGIFYFDFFNCKARENFQLIFDDNGTIPISDTLGYAKDSVVIYNLFGLPTSVDMGTISIQIKPWGPLTELSEVINRNSDHVPIHVSSNNEFYTVSNYANKCKVKLYDIYGNLVFENYIEKNESLTIPNILNGINILIVYNDSFFVSKKYINIK